MTKKKYKDSWPDCIRLGFSCLIFEFVSDFYIRIYPMDFGYLLGIYY